MTTTEGQNDLSALRESAALADDPTQNQEIENRFDSALVDMPRTSGAGQNFGDGDFDLIDSLSSEDGFYPKLFKQVNLTFTVPADRIIATHFINALEPTGWISSSADSIAQESGCSVEQAENVLVALQGFEPAGIFARDLAECLKIQLIENNQFSPLFGQLLDNLEQLGRGEIKQLARKFKCAPEDIVEMLSIIRTLNPKPGEHLGIEFENASPDVIATRKKQGWSVELNRSTLPSVLVNEHYAELMAKQKRADQAVQDYSAETLTNAAG